MAAAEPAYGSDENGLVWGYRFAPAAAALPVSLYESLRSEVGATRLEQDGDVLVALIHDVVFDFSFDASMVATTSLCITPRLLVSARLRPLRSADQLKSAVRTGQQFHSPIELLSHLLLAQASVLTDIVRRSTMRVNQVEDRLLARRASVSRAELGSLRRSLIRIQRLLAPEPAALFRLLNRPPRWISETDRQDLRQAAEEFASAVGDTLALAERVTVLQEELAALVSEQTSRTLFVLTLVTVLALPINLVAALFGMNVGGVPLAGHPYGFALVVVTLVASTGALARWVWRRRPD